jgi:hypothetical protein
MPFGIRIDITLAPSLNMVPTIASTAGEINGELRL